MARGIDRDRADPKNRQGRPVIVTSKTPLRVSLFGGGTDYPAYFERHRGAVIGFTINKYIYISALRLGSYVDYQYRISYSRVEMVDDASSIQHPVVRALINHYNCTSAMDFSVQSDLPASIGLGSSSAFTVGFINLISRLQGIPRTKLELAREAIFAEQKLLDEHVGVQDQMHAAFGGFNRFDFERNAPFTIRPLDIRGAELKALTDWMVLVYTGVKRRATEVVEEQVKNTSAGKIDADLSSLLDLVEVAQVVLEREHGDKLPTELARLLHESWGIKKRFSTKISSDEIDALYDRCIQFGALGGKLCGAGGGGFLLMIVPPDRRADFTKALQVRRCVDFEIDFSGSVVSG
jgi:D-glycero-alpha-D-manno-heptose-7-phosphate kinase